MRRTLLFALRNAAVTVAALIPASTGLLGAPRAHAAIAQRTSAAATQGTTRAATQPATPLDPDDVRIRALLQQLEQMAQRSDADAYLALLAGAADRLAAEKFLAGEFRTGVTRVVLQERDRQRLAGTLPGNGYSLTLDAFFEYGNRARVATWQLDITRAGDTWRIVAQAPLSSVENLYRLTLNTTRQFDAKNFTVAAEDFELTLAEGTVFTVDTDQGTTGLVLMGRGDMRFHPAPKSEVEQVRIFAGADTLESRFEVAFVRVGSLNAHADRGALVRRAEVDARDARRAEQVFKEESAKSFIVDLADLTRDTWSLLPGGGDFLAEVRTRRFDALTYSRSASEAEDISFFERRRHRNIAAYASKDKLASRGRFYNEDDLTAFDVLFVVAPVVAFEYVIEV